MSETTHFGFRTVAVEEKQRLVRHVFDSVAERYDLMNDLMSMGVHRAWKRYLAGISGARPGDSVLDLAGGTGDVAALLHQRVGESGRVLLGDINGAMLRVGRSRLLDRGLMRGLEFVQLNAEALPFPDASFDLVTIAFGLRNVTDKDRALREMHRVLRVGGRVMVLEFSEVRSSLLKPFYDLYSFQVLPRVGRMVADDEDSYRYLAESIRKHPNQAALKTMMVDAGFEEIKVHNLSAGIVALHSGYRV